MSVVALAGRRVDAADAHEPRFPSANIGAVRIRLRDQLQALGVETLVASGAAGADLLGLEEAQRLGARTVVILPFDRAKFRTTSVEDRPDPEFWTGLYERILAASDVETLPQTFASESQAYAAVTRRIIERAVEADGPEHATALAVWDGRSRGAGDNSEDFIRYAKKCGLRVIEVSTLA